MLNWDRLADRTTDPQPFPHLIVDCAVGCAEPLARTVEGFVGRHNEQMYDYDNALERKFAYDALDRMPHGIQDVLRELNEPRFLTYLEERFEIEGLIPDPYLRGGGVHAVPPGGHLDVHVDFNVHPKLGLHRRLNVLLYLNPSWPAGPGGALELWTAHRNFAAPGAGVFVPDDWKPEALARRFAPILGRLVVFETSERSFHGHPVPTPPDRWRYALSSYYYTAAEPPGGAAPYHSTRFVALPGEAPDPERQALRERRDRGRLSSNTEGRS